MTMQSVFKHILTEGDKFLVSHISALEDQGGYALANNYGERYKRIYIYICFLIVTITRISRCSNPFSARRRDVTSLLFQKISQW